MYSFIWISTESKVLDIDLEFDEKRIHRRLKNFKMDCKFQI